MLTTIKEGPRYHHRCDECIFLGRYKESDLYYCPKQQIALARYGGKPDDFRAEKSAHSHAREAKRRAAEQDFDSPDPLSLAGRKALLGKE